MTLANKTTLNILLVMLLLALGAGIGWILHAKHQPATQQVEAMPSPPARKVLYWYDPMMPQQHFDQPGKSPFMDMQLIAKYADEEASTGMSIDARVSQNIGMRLATVSRIPLNRQIEVTGLIGFDERDVAIVQTRTAGFVEHVWPLADGDLVTAGQPLAEVLQPGWLAAQQEFLAVRNLGDANLLTAAKQRLQLQGMPDKLIRQLAQSGEVQNHYTITAPIAGVVQNLEVRNGMSLIAGQTLLRINGLSTVWLDVAIPEAEADMASMGNTAEVRLSDYAAETLQGRIAQILPSLNAASRSLRVRITLKNPRQQLRPGMSAQVKLNSHAQGSGLAVPSEALIRTGKRTLVIIAKPQGRFSPQEVSIAHEIGQQTLVNAGLEEGQQVVVSGQFLIDSEASLNGMPVHDLNTTQQNHMENAP